jgi:hypothetical protein
MTSGAEESGIAENRPHLIGTPAHAHHVEDRPVLDSVADLLEASARHRTERSRVKEHELAAPDRVEGIGPCVARRPLPVEEARDSLERVPEQEHARVRERLGGRDAGRPRRPRIRVGPDHLPPRTYLVDCREIVAAPVLAGLVFCQ